MVLRLHPVLPANGRLFDKEVELLGYKIPPLTRITINNWVSTRDPRNYKDPLTFDETRVPRRECPFGSKSFGAGARQCPGERLARMELAVMTCALVHRFRIELEDPSVEIKEVNKLLMCPSPDSKAKVRFVPRAAAAV